MGILPEPNDRRPIRIEDIIDAEAQRAITYADYVFDDSEGEEVDDALLQPNRRPITRFEANCKQRCKRDERRDYRVSKREKWLYASDGLKERKNMGSQKMRRIENARILLNFTDPQDICYDGSDLLPETITAFSRLLSDEENMKAWNEFIELDEAEQRQILDDIDDMSRRGVMKTQKPTTSTAKEDKRAHHPAFSARACFDRLEKKFKNAFLKSRNLPMQFLGETEEQLRSFFSSSPRGVYVEALMSKMKRFYFHAMAQFLSLTSKTLNEEGSTSSCKMLQVTNEHGQFNPPARFLVDIICERRRNRANKGVS